MAARQSDSTGGRAATQRTLCIDHSVVTHEASWPALAHSLASGKLRLALSLWNLVEIGAASDKAQQRRRLTFLEKFNPLWIVERVSIQKQEVQGFLWKNVFRAAPTEPQVFTPHLSVVDSYHEGHKARIGLTASQWIAGIDFEGIEKRKDLAPNALKFLQTVDRQTLEDREDEIFKPWIEPLLPTADPDGRALTKVRGAELLNYCAEHRDEFFAWCKSLAVEDALTAARATTARKRKPQRSDGIDLMHAVIGLAYCDFFLARDGFVRTCSSHAIKALAPVRLAALFENTETLRDELATPPPAT